VFGQIYATRDPPWGCGEDVLVLRLRQPDHADHLVAFRGVVGREIEAIRASNREALVAAMYETELVELGPGSRLEALGQRLPRRNCDQTAASGTPTAFRYCCIVGEASSAW
jgi:hypothetical protein